MITYFVRKDPTDNHLSLMRQVNARTPAPVAEYIEDLQISYDMLNDSANPVGMVAKRRRCEFGFAGCRQTKPDSQG